MSDKPTLESVKAATLLALYEHLHSDSLEGYLQPNQIKALTAVSASEKFFGMALGQLWSEELINNQNNVRVFSITVKGVQKVERSRVSKLNSPKVPASDRIVALDHNSPPVSLIEEALERLGEEIRSNNEAFVNDVDARSVALSEIASLKTLWKSAAVRVDRFRSQADASLKWIAEKVSVAAIAELCKHIMKLIFGWP